MEEKKRFYITTPIYYPSDKLHIGHTYCTVATDAMARYKRLTGCDVLFLTGTDEHGQKIEDKAKEAGVTPKEFVDRIVEGPRGVKDLWKLMNISNDRFIRTTDDYHVSAIQKIFKKMYEKGDIYKGRYVGKYCKPCESFWTASPASPSGPSPSWWTASAPTAAGRSRTRRRRPTSSACPSTRTRSSTCWRTPTFWSPAAG